MSIKENPLVAVIEESIRLKDSAQAILSEAMEGTPLSRLERLVLIMISEADTPMTVSQMGRALGHPRQVIQRVANRLEELGMLNRLANPDHKASSLFEPTAEGLKYERQLGNALQDIVEALLTDKDEKMCLRISGELKHLRDLIEAYQASREGRT